MPDALVRPQLRGAQLTLAPVAQHRYHVVSGPRLVRDLHGDRRIGAGGYPHQEAFLDAEWNQLPRR